MRDFSRRDFVTLLGGAAAWPLAARAQQIVPLVGLLTGTQQDDRWLGALRQGLKEAGYVEGRNVAIKHRSAGGEFEPFLTLALVPIVDQVFVISWIAPREVQVRRHLLTIDLSLHS